MKTLKILSIINLLLLSSCNISVTEADVNVIKVPTQITTEQFQNFTIDCGSLYGLPSALGHQTKIHGNILIKCGGLIQDLFIDGCVEIDGAPRYELNRVWIENCHTNGIIIKNNSCCGRIIDVVVINNRDDGAKLVDTADTLMTLSEFENNHGYGLRLENSSTPRIVNSDFGGNDRGGIFADRESALLMLTNNQFGNNKGDDIILESANNIMNSLEFIGPPGHCSIKTKLPQTYGTNFYGRPQC